MALIFPGAILPAVGKVTQGKRHAFLPFIYDDAAAKVREANRKFLVLDHAASPVAQFGSAILVGRVSPATKAKFIAWIGGSVVKLLCATLRFRVHDPGGF